GAVRAAGYAVDRRQGPDRGHRRLYGDLFRDRLQWLSAAEDVSHLSLLGSVGRRLRPAPLPLNLDLTTPRRRAPAAALVAGKELTMIAIRLERPADVTAREALLDLSFGRGRFDKTSERLREGRLPADKLAYVAVDGGRVVGTVRLWHVSTGAGRP